MARIAIGGFQHETNTFAPHPGDLEAFENVASFPQIPRGMRVIEEMGDLNVGIGGFIRTARAAGHELVPTVWATAVPSAHVTDQVFELIAASIVDGIRAAGQIDGVYLCLHGAMVVESYEDGEGELLRRVRAAVGPDVPVVGSLDLHCNTTEAMIAHSDALVAYRTYPHVDMGETGERAAALLQWMLDTGRRPAKALRKTGFLIPLVWQCSLIEPAKSIYGGFAARETDGVLSLSFTPGFPPADIAECGPAVFAYGETQEAADAAADAVFAQVDGARGRWSGKLYSPDDAIRRAMEGPAGRPFVLADTQDNPGAGGASDTVGVLESLVRLDARDAVFACVYDPAAAEAAHQAGIGAAVELAIGAGTGQPGQEPFRGRFEVSALSNGEFEGTGPMAGGRTYRLGPCAVLRIGGVEVMIASGRAQVLDQAILRHIGIDPTARRILAIKSSVHFRADFQSMAQEVLVVVSPGPNAADNRDLPFRHLRAGLDVSPDGPAFVPPAGG